MFSVTTMHSDMGRDEEQTLSKMYAGNPIAALGNMIIMRSNAEKIRDQDVNMNIVIETLTACIKLLSDEVTFHQSGMVSDDDNPNLNLVNVPGSDEPQCSVIGKPCGCHIPHVDSNVEYCTHPGNSKKDEEGPNHCTHTENSQDGKCVACPFSSDFIPF